MSPKARKKMVGKRVGISLSRQCETLRISRSSLYYTPMGFSAETLKLMRQIAASLPRKGYHIQATTGWRRLMKMMGLEAIYKRPS